MDTTAADWASAVKAARQRAGEAHAFLEQGAQFGTFVLTLRSQ